MLKVWVGDRMRYIMEYKSSWPESFEKIMRAIHEELPKTCKIHHVGSTAVPGMPAKDIIDVDIECPAGGMADVIRALAGLGYEHQGDKGIPGREAFCPMPDSVVEELPPHHLYACEESALELRKHLAFRDFILTHGDRMRWLAEQKRLADQTACSRDEYIQNKSQAYATITAEALEWADGSEQEYDGVYVGHWEVARFVVPKGQWFFGLFQRVEFWEAIFPEGFTLPRLDPAKPMREQSGFFRMKVRGRLGPRGHFAHKGICCRQLHVIQVLVCEKTESPGKTW